MFVLYALLEWDADFLQFASGCKHMGLFITPHSLNTKISCTSNHVSAWADKSRDRGIGTFHCTEQSRSLILSLHHLLHSTFYAMGSIPCHHHFQSHLPHVLFLQDPVLCTLASYYYELSADALTFLFSSFHMHRFSDSLV